MEARWFDEVLDATRHVTWTSTSRRRARGLLSEIATLNGGAVDDERAVRETWRRRFAVARASAVLQRFGVDLSRLSDRDAVVAELEAVRTRLAAAPFHRLHRVRHTEASVVNEIVAEDRRVAGLVRHAARKLQGGLVLDRQYLDVLASLIESARDSIYAAMFYFRYTAAKSYPTRPIMDRLLRARARRVDVKIILDRDREGEIYASRRINLAAYRRLNRRGRCAVFDSPDVVTHSKLIVVDREHVLLGSHNWTGGSLAAYDDTSVYIRSRTLGRWYARELLDQFEACLGLEQP